MKYRIIMLFIFITILFSYYNYCHAITIKQYGEYKDSVAQDIYVYGLAEGIFTVNYLIKSKKIGDQLYCVPDNLKLNSENYVSLLKDGIKDLRNVMTENECSNLTVAFVLIHQLQKVFPCK